MNQFLWDFINGLGWWYWGPLVGIGTFLLMRLFQLAAPKTRLGRWGRMFAIMGALCLVFTPQFNVLGCIGIYLLTLSLTIVTEQVFRDCKKAGKIGAHIPPVEEATASLVEAYRSKQ
jgi:hypothetical protein